MRLITIRDTIPAFYRREQTVTRRPCWIDLRVGELLCGVSRVRLPRGQSPMRLGVVVVTDVRFERLGAVRRQPADMAREGFAGMRPVEFLERFSDRYGLTSRSRVTRIEFRHVPGVRMEVPGFCRQCGCWDCQACWHEDLGACWWVDDRGRATLGETTLCSHCQRGLDCGPSDALISREIAEANL